MVNTTVRQNILYTTSPVDKSSYGQNKLQKKALGLNLLFVSFNQTKNVNSQMICALNGQCLKSFYTFSWLENFT